VSTKKFLSEIFRLTDKYPWSALYVRNFKEMRKYRISQPVMIGKILPEVMADIKKRMMRHRNRRNVGAKRNEHNRSSLRRQGRRLQASLSKLPV